MYSSCFMNLQDQLRKYVGFKKKRKYVGLAKTPTLNLEEISIMIWGGDRKRKRTESEKVKKQKINIFKPRGKKLKMKGWHTVLIISEIRTPETQNDLSKYSLGPGKVVFKKEVSRE